MGKELSVNVMEQQFENTCWKAVAKMVLDYMERYMDAENIMEEEDDPMGSAVELLHEYTGYNFLKDQKPIPDFQEIVDEIDADRLLIGYVVTNIVTEANGHWILITGYDSNGLDANGVYLEPIIKIVDPYNGLNGDNEFWISYNDIFKNEKQQYCIPRRRIVTRYFKSVSYMPKN